MTAISKLHARFQEFSHTNMNQRCAKISPLNRTFDSVPQEETDLGRPRGPRGKFNNSQHATPLVHVISTTLFAELSIIQL